MCCRRRAVPLVGERMADEEPAALTAGHARNASLRRATGATTATTTNWRVTDD
jgi:hypothetical protein